MWEKKYARVSYSHTYIKKKTSTFSRKKNSRVSYKKNLRLVRKKKVILTFIHTQKFSSVSVSGTSFRSSAVSHPQTQPPPQPPQPPRIGCPVLKVHNRDQTWMNLAFDSQLYILFRNKNVFCTYVRVIKITCMIFFFDLWLAIHLIVISLFI